MLVFEKETIFRCCECEKKFDEPDVWQESRGEFWGVPCSETMSGCPYCGGDYEEVYVDEDEEDEESEEEDDE